MCTLLQGVPSHCIMLPCAVMLIFQLSAIRWQWWRQWYCQWPEQHWSSTSLKNGQYGDKLQLQNENEEIHFNESPAVGEEQQNYVRDNFIKYCKEQVFNSLVEILKYLQKSLVQGRPFEIADALQCTDGETNLIMVDRSNLLNTAIGEIKNIYSIYKINF